MNNKPANFDSVPSPTSLELVWATEQVIELQKVGDPKECPLAFKYVTKELLTNDGYSELPPQMSFVAIELAQGQTPKDTAAKMAAIKLYLNHMRSL